MAIDFLIPPQSKNDIKAVRVYLGWTQPQLAYKCDCNTSTINTLETGKHNATKDLLDKITLTFAKEGIRFNLKGGFNIEKDIINFYKGINAYPQIQEDIIKTCSENKDEVLYFGGDDAWSTNEVIKKDTAIYNLDIPIKCLVRKNAKCIAYPDKFYKVVSDNNLLFDLIIVYKDKVIFTVDFTFKPYTCKLLSIKDKNFAEKWRKYFYSLWNNH